MKYSKEEVLQYVSEEDVKFIRLAFCDIFGKQKNISIMPSELERAFRYGIAIDGSAIVGFDSRIHSDLILHPDPSTLSVLPWRPEHGRVVRMFCTITQSDGKSFGADTRAFLQDAIKKADEMGISFAFGSEMEFYLFKCDENGEATTIPYDKAGYMDIAPTDKGENVRREICLYLEQMGIYPESSHHEEGPGQNEIDFRYSEPLHAADDAITFKAVVNTVSSRNGLYADFSPKPLPEMAGNGMHINISAKSKDGSDIMPQVIAGILAHIREITVFLNTTENSYNRFGGYKAPKYISWSDENRSQLIRIPAAEEENKRAELRSPDPMCNPYIAYAMVIYAGLDGIKNKLPLMPPRDYNLFDAGKEETASLELIPQSIDEAKNVALQSEWTLSHITEEIKLSYLK